MVAQKPGQKVSGFEAQDGGMNERSTDQPATDQPATDQPLTELPTGDPRPAFREVFALAGCAIAGVRPDQLGDPTPCEGYDVRGMLAHLRLVAARVDHIGRGIDPMAVDEAAFTALDWAVEWERVGASIDAGWADDAVLAAVVALPWATMPGAGALRMYTSELLTHLWDLATATGQQPDYPTATVEASLALMQQFLPADARVEHVPFGAVVPTGPDAAAIERLAAWTGRDPSWRAAALRSAARS